ncbi:MAG TPA: beta-galactosidase [Verrucomicrobiae bacterium]|nr:beta-galactosidase [Verrucomicrobiae bacterium]
MKSARLLAIVMLASSAYGEPVRFPHPDRIRYDGQCLTIDGKDTLIFSGSFHYTRCPQPLWRDRFQKIKEAGFNTVETYVPWNWYERDEPADPGDLSQFDFRDLKAWLKMAHDEFGLYTIIRPGPYICAEWDGGGFPRWLLTLKPAHPKRPVWLRSDDPVYLRWSKHWYDAVCPVIAAEQVTRKPNGHAGVILFQIENEYDLYYRADLPDEERVNHLRALYQYARADGIEVPMFTCWTKQCRASTNDVLRNVMDGVNMYPRWNMKAVVERLGKLRAEQPNAPVMVPELQGGWFAQVGHQLSEDQEGMDATQINHLTLLNLQEGTTILNYYMLFGGSNFGDWASRDQLSSYDYFAPIRECGGVGDKYLAVKAIGLMLRQYGTSLARSRPVHCETDATDKELTIAIRRGANGDQFVFCRNTSHTKPIHGSATVTLDGGGVLKIDYDLAAGGFKILHLPANQPDAAGGEWLPKPAVGPDRPATIPSTVRIQTALRRNDPGGNHWASVTPGASLPDCGVDDSRFVLYRSRFRLSPEQLKKFQYLAPDLFTTDKVVLQMNGKIIVPSQPLVFVGDALQVGDNDLLMLYENRGQPNFGSGLADLSGVRSVRLSSRAGLSTPLENWRVKLLPPSDARGAVATNFDDSTWDSFTLDDQTIAELAALGQPGAVGPKNPAATILFGKNATAVYRARVELSDEMIRTGRTKLILDSVEGNGTVYVNGAEVGKTGESQQWLNKDVAARLKPGVNVVAAVVSNKVGNGGLTGGVRLMGGGTEGVELKLALARQLSGVANRWWRDRIDVSGWGTMDLDTKKEIERKGKDAPAGKPTALATWYRMEFELPAPSTNVWVPWRLLLDCSGNGFVYLNGHALGRYWDVGPQREYYLPECWLRFGAGGTNTLALCLRPTEKGAVLRAAEVAPYSDYAERR